MEMETNIKNIQITFSFELGRLQMVSQTLSMFFTVPKLYNSGSIFMILNGKKKHLGQAY